MYATVAAAAALHQVLLRSLGEDKVVAQNVASGLFCVLFVALGVSDRPTLLAATMLGYLISDSASVTTIDHYCSWIGSPVGARNHFYYVAFLFFSSLDVAIMGPASALRFVRLARSKHSIERVSPLTVVGLALLACYCFGVLVWTGSLLVDQAGLIARNETSIERVKKTWRGRPNPHDRGAFRNWLDFLFRATPSVVLELDQVESRCEAA